MSKFPVPGLSFETALLIVVLAFIIWRRRKEDRLLLGVLISLIPTVLLVAWYPDLLYPFYIVPVGSAFAYFFLPDSRTGETGRRFALAASALAFVLLLRLTPFLSTGTHWLLRGQLPPFFYTEIREPLRPFVGPDDLVTGTHSLVWTFPEHRQLVSFASEYLAMQKWGYDDPALVWERVQPAVIIHVVGEMTFPEGLQTYIQHHDFVLCADLQQFKYEVRVYRQVCPPGYPRPDST